MIIEKLVAARRGVRQDQVGETTTWNAGANSGED